MTDKSHWFLKNIYIADRHCRQKNTSEREDFIALCSCRCAKCVCAQTWKKENPMCIINITHTYVADSPAHLTTAAYVSPHCAHIFRLMQVTTGMHNIRAFTAEKQQTVNVRREGWRVAVAGLSRSSCTNRQTLLSITSLFFLFFWKEAGPTWIVCKESRRVRGAHTDWQRASCW